MVKILGVVVGGVLCFVMLFIVTSCEDSTGPVTVSGYEVTLSAHPDSIPNSGAVSTIHAIVTDLATQSQAGGLELEFASNIGIVTGIGTSSATDPTGISPPYVYFACQDSYGVAIISVTVKEDGHPEATGETEVFVYQEGLELTFYADPDTINNTGQTALVFSIIRDNVTGNQVGGLDLEFGAIIGSITPTGVSSATDPTGVQPPLIFYSGLGVEGTAMLRIRVYDQQELILTDTTEVVVCGP